MTHTFQPGDRAMILNVKWPTETDAFDGRGHCFDVHSIHIVNSMGSAAVHINDGAIPQGVCCEQLQLLQPHHTGLPDLLDAE